MNMQHQSIHCCRQLLSHTDFMRPEEAASPKHPVLLAHWARLITAYVVIRWAGAEERFGFNTLITSFSSLVSVSDLGDETAESRLCLHSRAAEKDPFCTRRQTAPFRLVVSEACYHLRRLMPDWLWEQAMPLGVICLPRVGLDVLRIPLELSPGPCPRLHRPDSGTISMLHLGESRGCPPNERRA
jgi:hypothetical protein